MEQENSTDDVIVNQEQEAVVEQEDQSTGSVTTEGQEQEQQQEVEATEVEVEVDDKWKNRAYELERKLGNLTNELPKIIEENVAKATTNKTEEKEYSIAELEAYALEHPEHRPWVEEQKEVKRKKEWKQMFKAEKEEQSKAQKKIQSEQRTLSNPKYAEAFVKQNGQTVLNPESKMAQLIHGYMSDPGLKGRADALEIAAKIAYADCVDTSVKEKESKLTSVKRQNAVLKQKTMVDGGGVNDNAPVVSNFDSANERLAKTGNRKDAEAAVKAYFARRNGA